MRGISKWSVAAVAAALLACGIVPAIGAGAIYVYGDSTGKGDGAQRPWHPRMLEILADGRTVENFSRSRQAVQKIIEGLEAAQGTALPTVIVYDRRNAGETVDDYVAALHKAAELIGHERFLILPQIPVSGGREDRLTLEVLLGINERLLAEFADNTFDAATQKAFMAALSGDETRSDRIHRNDTGQEIEARYIADWLRAKGY